MVHARNFDLPLYFRAIIPGSVLNVATLAATADILRALGLSDVTPPWNSPRKSAFSTPPSPPLPQPPATPSPK